MQYSNRAKFGLKGCTSLIIPYLKLSQTQIMILNQPRHNQDFTMNGVVNLRTNMIKLLNKNKLGQCVIRQNTIKSLLTSPFLKLTTQPFLASSVFEKLNHFGVSGKKLLWVTKPSSESYSINLLGQDQPLSEFQTLAGSLKILFSTTIADIPQ